VIHWLLPVRVKQMGVLHHPLGDSSKGVDLLESRPAADYCPFPKGFVVSLWAVMAKGIEVYYCVFTGIHRAV
jgi:hypothetical protein